ncbi:PAS domain S-box protein [Aquabacterium sp.]|uniref:PAS domain-containing hybrid sensor histidine kinase/response regulator n=1 Tax=Aquabacterium sp. TaxID=1872578 RepID=UPI00378519CC
MSSLLPQTASQEALRLAVLRTFFIGCAAAALAAIANLLIDPGTRANPINHGLIVGYAVLALGSAAAIRLRLRQAQRALLVVALGGLAMVGSRAIGNGLGLQAPGLVFFSLLTCVSCIVGEQRHGWMVAAAAAAVVLVLAASELTGLAPLARAASPVPLPARTIAQLVAVLIGAATGRLVSRLVAEHVRESAEREQRFRGLLGIAAAAYWETDEQLRLCHASLRDERGQFVPQPLLPRRPPWELAELRFDDDAMDTLRADMESRSAFRDVALAWAAPGAPLQHFLASGEPQHDGEGRFIGYWGVARDITAEHKAREVLIATEQRYEELFRRAPTPLVLHRLGVVLDANPAAATLFGFETVAQMIGADLAGLYPSPEAAHFARQRSEQIPQLAPGDALPAVEALMLTRAAQQRRVSETAVRADTDGEAATLSIFVDLTAQQAAEQALRRSQALLSQVVSMSPDIITLTDLQTGRYEMVNPSFTRVIGYPAAEVEGRTAVEMGVWPDETARRRVMQQVLEKGFVEDADVEFRRRDGAAVHLLVSATRFQRDGRDFVVINARDVTETSRQRMEREAILDNASIGIAFTRERRFVMVNPHFEQMYGWPPGAIVGQPGRVVWPSDADYDSLGAEVGKPLRRGEQVEFERLAARRDGSTFVVRMRAKAIDPEHPNESGTIWIAEDVTAQRQAEAALARARDDAEAANRAKSTFLANTSHEIRTPLNGLVGLARLARQPNVDPARLDHYLEQIGAGAETLSAIISDILDLSKIEAGKLEVEAAPFDLLALLHSLQQAYSALADSHGLQFVVSIDPRVPQAVRGDALRVRQILANFLHNALKFTPRGGLTLLVKPAADTRVRFEVHDTGLGIDEATQARLFKPFTQADESITRRFGGTGLGLSICRELATLMGGEVGVSSQPGVGSCFHAELPLPPEQDIGAVSGHGALDSDPLRGAHVLLVEDNAVNMMIGVALLEQWGAVVAQAGDGPQALDAVAAAAEAGRPFDVVLMDVQMPGMSGYEATRLLRQHYSLLELPIIALTAAALTSERERAAEIGMNDFLTKPIDANRMRMTLQRVLSAGEAALGD